MSCQCCGQCGCQCGKLPYAMTATFSGLPEAAQTGNCELSFSSCFGDGARGVVLAPGGCDNNDPACKTGGSVCIPNSTTYAPSDRGPITQVLLTDGGSCYAVPGRVAPILTASVSPGTGASFTVSTVWEPREYNCNLPEWRVSSVSASGGYGYEDGSDLIVTHSVGDTKLETAAGYIRANRLVPSLSASAGNSSLSVSLRAVGWGVASISVNEGGSGYADGVLVNIPTPDGVVAKRPAKAALVVGEDGEILSVRVISSGDYAAPAQPTITAIAVGGSGGQLSVVMKETAWGVDSLSVLSGGSGNSPDIPVFVTASGLGDFEEAPCKAFASVSENGSVQSISVADPGRYYNRTGPTLAVVTRGGWYYREDADAPPYVSNVEVTAPCGGSGESITANINSDITSVNFGKIQSLTINNGGQGHLAWRPNSSACFENLNNKPIVMLANDPIPLVQLCPRSCFGSGLSVRIVPVGQKVPSTAEDSCATSDDSGYYRQYPYAGEVTPIRQIQLTSGGAGYAKLGRESPSLTVREIATITSGSGASFTPTVAASKDKCGVDYYYIESVAVAGGTCYGIKGRSAPTFAVSGGGGSGAKFEVSLEQTTDKCGGNVWSVSEISVSGGGGYADGAALTLSADSGTVVREAAVATVAASNGVPTGVSIAHGGQYFKKGPSERLEVVLATANDKQEQAAILKLLTDDDGVPTEVIVQEQGVYYRENAKLPPYVANVTIDIDQASGSSGSGAYIAVTQIDSNPLSPNFGRVTDVSLVSGGSGYTLFGGSDDCTYTGVCWWCDIYGMNPVGASFTATLAFRGAGKAPEVLLTDYAPVETESSVVFRGADVIRDCTAISTSGTVLHGASGGSVTITRGGDITANAEACECPEGCETGACVCNEDCGPNCCCVDGECAPNPCEEGQSCCNGDCCSELEFCCDGTCTTEECGCGPSNCNPYDCEFCCGPPTGGSNAVTCTTDGSLCCRPDVCDQQTVSFGYCGVAQVFLCKCWVTAVQCTSLISTVPCNGDCPEGTTEGQCFEYPLTPGCAQDGTCPPGLWKFCTKSTTIDISGEPLFPARNLCGECYDKLDAMPGGVGARAGCSQVPGSSECILGECGCHADCPEGECCDPVTGLCFPCACPPPEEDGCCRKEICECQYEIDGQPIQQWTPRLGSCDDECPEGSGNKRTRTACVVATGVPFGMKKTQCESLGGTWSPGACRDCGAVSGEDAVCEGPCDAEDACPEGTQCSNDLFFGQVCSEPLCIPLPGCCLTDACWCEQCFGRFCFWTPISCDEQCPGGGNYTGNRRTHKVCNDNLGQQGRAACEEAGGDFTQLANCTPAANDNGAPNEDAECDLRGCCKNDYCECERIVPTGFGDANPGCCPAGFERMAGTNFCKKVLPTGEFYNGGFGPQWIPYWQLEGGGFPFNPGPFLGDGHPLSCDYGCPDDYDKITKQWCTTMHASQSEECLGEFAPEDCEHAKNKALNTFPNMAQECVEPPPENPLP